MILKEENVSLMIEAIHRKYRKEIGDTEKRKNTEKEHIYLQYT